MSVIPGLEMRHRPADNYASRQNPPDFAWPYVEEADGYDLIVCRDRDLRDVAYKKEYSKTNYYNFPHVFEAGMYYWSVRHRKGNETSPWCAARRFLLDPDATPFPVPDIDTMLSSIPAGHPRIYTHPDHLAEFRREMLSPNNEYFCMIRRAVKGYMQRPFPTEESANPYHSGKHNMYSPFLYASDNIKAACNMAMFAAFHYLVTQDEAVGRYGVNCLMQLAAWDPDGCTSYAINDQGHRRVAVYSTLAYDWLMPLLTDEQRKIVLGMIEARTHIMCRSKSYNITRLDKSPFDSHGNTALGYVTLIALATYGEIPAAEGWLRYTLPLMANSLSVWGGEDGGWSQGTYYWSCNIFGKKVHEALRIAGVLDLYKKAWQKNQVYYPLYFHPEGSVGVFGDNSYIPATGKLASVLSMLALRIGTPESKWLRNQYGYITAYGHTDDPDPSVCCHDRLYSPQEAYLPDTLRPEHYMKDIGWVAMHSDLADPQRISMFFKSSWYGSHNHSHADQNSFVIQAFGERLAIDSGYYDLYNTPFDKDYTRKTYAHNAITYGNGQCQSPMDILAKGKITDYLSHSRLALTGGDATQAYKGGIGKAQRWLVYIKPNIVVVIDDLAAAPGQTTTFEYWLNAQKWLHLHDDERGGKAVINRATLDLRVHYPQAINAFISKDFTGTDGEPLYPVYEGYARSQIEKRMWFQTESVQATKFVTTLDIHKTGTPQRVFAPSTSEGCMTLPLPDGMQMFINLNDAQVQHACNIAFCGVMALNAPDTQMLVCGTRLEVYGRLILEADAPVSAVISQSELSISCISGDAVVRVYAPGLSRVWDERLREVTAQSGNIGATVEIQKEYAIFTLFNGAYSFKLERDAN